MFFMSRIPKSACISQPKWLNQVFLKTRRYRKRRALIRILGTEIKKLRNREVKLVKVQWGEADEDATWETEEKMRGLYPFLFESTFSISFPS